MKMKEIETRLHVHIYWHFYVYPHLSFCVLRKTEIKQGIVFHSDPNRLV